MYLSGYIRRDVSSAYPGQVFIILCLTHAPSAAISAVRCARRGEDSPLIDTLIIYQLEENKHYDLSNFTGGDKSPVVYSSFRKIGPNESWQEVFFDNFRIMNRRRISIKDQRADPGMFRSVVLFEVGVLTQIDQDVASVEEALGLCLQAIGSNGFSFQIYNDKGEPQVEVAKLKLS